MRQLTIAFVFIVFVSCAYSQSEFFTGLVKKAAQRLLETNKVKRCSSRLVKEEKATQSLADFACSLANVVIGVVKNPDRKNDDLVSQFAQKCCEFGNDGFGGSVCIVQSGAGGSCQANTCCANGLANIGNRNQCDRLLPAASALSVSTSIRIRNCDQPAAENFIRICCRTVTVNGIISCAVASDATGSCAANNNNRCCINLAQNQATCTAEGLGNNPTACQAA